MPGFTHTMVPIVERDLLIVTDEASGKPGGRDWPKRHWVVDVSRERHPLIISNRGGRR